MKVKGTGSRCLLEECVKDNYFARFHLHSYHYCREMNFNVESRKLTSSVEIKFNHCCRKMNFISRLDANFLDSTQNIDKVSGAWNEGQGHQVKVPSWKVCQGQLLCKVSSTQLPLLQRNELYFYTRRKFSRLNVKFCQNSGVWNEGQGHWVKVPAWRVCQG